MAAAAKVGVPPSGPSLLVRGGATIYLHGEFSPESDFTYEAELQVYPEFELPEYKG